MIYQRPTVNSQVKGHGDVMEPYRDLPLSSRAKSALAPSMPDIMPGMMSGMVMS